MSTWRVRMKAVIDDEMEVDADTEEEAIELAEEDWTFTEAGQWESSAQRIGGEDE